MSTLYLGLIPGTHYGWGLASHYITRELAKLTDIELLGETVALTDQVELQGPLFQILQNELLVPQFCARGNSNYGYVFFEQEPNVKSAQAAENYDVVFTGSRWCRNKLIDCGVKNAQVLLQGVDHALFYPEPQKEQRETFTIFSGGKLEFRKGQDLVLRAFASLQDTYPDLRLATLWYNYLPSTMKSMEQAPGFSFQFPGEIFQSNGLLEEAWRTFMNDLYQQNGIDPNRVTTWGRTDRKDLRSLYLSTDIGLFPNRCEGGTNLVMMEYMSCGKPVIVSDATGHRDVVDASVALLLDQFQECRIFDRTRTPVALWQTPDLDQIIAQIEFAYHNRSQIQDLATRATLHMQQFSWEGTAREIVNTVL